MKMKHKLVSIAADFPELRGASCKQQAHATGSSTRTATCKAFATLLRGERLKRTRFTKFTATVTVEKVYK